MSCNQKILIVDDNARNLVLLNELLSELNVTIHEATSGPDALELVSKNCYNLIFLDIQMPKMNGYELAEFILKDPKNKHVPIIFLTAVYTDDIYVKKGYTAGAIDFIVKPVNPTILLAKAKFFLEYAKQTDLILMQKKEILRQKNIIVEKNKDITDSLRYATRIQKAILPPNELVEKYFRESFIFYRPKDIVSGDFYWIKQRFSQVYVAVADCTGHGVPGALLSIVGNNELNRSSSQNIHPHDILNNLNQNIYEALNYQHETSTVLDGLDIAMCYIDTEDMIIEFSGAMSSLYHISNGELSEYKGDKVSIGSKVSKSPLFTGQVIDFEKGDTIYLFTDGYADQFGGPGNKKISYPTFKRLLLENSQKSMAEQYEILQAYFDEWKGKGEQIDDVLVMGIRL